MSARDDEGAVGVLAVAFLDVWRLPLRDRPRAILAALSLARALAGDGFAVAPVEHAAELALLRAEVERLKAQQPRGCICPPGAEATCKGLPCPRRAIDYRGMA